MNKIKLRKGLRVGFVVERLGASELDALHRVTDDIYGSGDKGVLAFPHPNQNGKPLNCKGWWYVEVNSKIGEPRKLYVAVPPEMIKVLS